MSRKIRLIVAMIVWAASEISVAAEEPAGKAEGAAKKAEDAANKAVDAAKRLEDMLKNPPTSGEDFTGDRLVLKSNVSGFTGLREKSEGGLALRGTILRVIRDKTVDKSGNDLLVTIEFVPCVVFEEKGSSPQQKDSNPTKKLRRDRTNIGIGGWADCAAVESEINKLVKADEAYSISKSDLEKFGFYRSGWVYGGLLVPYKYFRHDKSFSSATTIGPYVGYRLGGIGFDTALIGSAGLASLSVPDGSGGTSTQQGFTLAVGLIGSVTKNNNPLRLGVLVGKDWAGSNSPVPYPHEGKTWFAVQIGFDFTK